MRFLNEEELDEEMFEKQDWFWGPYLVAAGVLKLEEAVPGVLKSQSFDWDWINELAPQALAEMKSEAVVEQVAAHYRHLLTLTDKDEGAPVFLTIFFEHSDLPSAAHFAAELLQEDEDWFRQTTLAAAIASHLNGDSMPAALAHWKEVPGELERQHLIQFFHTYAILSGEEFTEMDQWRAHLKEEKKSDDRLKRGIRRGNSPLSQMMASIEESPFPGQDSPSNPARVKEPKPAPKLWVKPEIELGRNDPCHCGSGKKYKKCCMA